MNKFKKVMLGALSVLTLGLFAVVGTKVNAATVNYNVVAYTVSGETSSSNIIATGNRTKTTRINPSDENNTDSVVFSVGSSNTWGTDKGLSNGINVSSNTNASSRFYKVTVPAGYYISSFVVSTDAKTNVRELNLSANDSTTLIANTVSQNTVKSTTSNLEFVAEGKRMNYTNAGGDIYIHAPGSICVYSVNLTLQVDVLSGNAVTATFNPNGGTLTGNEQYTLDEPGTLNMPTAPTRAGYTFTGWKVGTTTLAVGTLSYDLQSNTEFVAQWDKNVNDWCTLTFDANGGSCSVSTVEVLRNTSYTLPTATKTGHRLLGWVNNSTTYSSTFSVPNVETATLTASWEQNKMPEQTDSKYILNANNISTGSIASGTVVSGTVFSFVTSDTLAVDEQSLTYEDGTSSETFTKRIKTGGTSTTTNRVIKMSVDVPGKLNIICQSGSSTTDRTAKVFKNDTTEGIVGTVNAVAVNPYLQSVTIAEAGTYYIGSSNSGVNFYYIEFIPAQSATELADNVNLVFDAQYNGATAADSSKLRFIGTIDGVAFDDYANISNMKFTFTFNDVARECEVTKLYKSIKSGETTVKAATDDTMYVVYQLNNINKAAYQGKKLTNCKFTVTFEDGSSVSVPHDDITLPDAFAKVVA